MNTVIALLLVFMGIGVDAVYQHKIRVAECDAYETGYQQGLKENTIHRQITVPELPPLQNVQEFPSMAAPVSMPPTFEERMRMHGRATAWIKRGEV